MTVWTGPFVVAMLLGLPVGIVLLVLGVLLPSRPIGIIGLVAMAPIVVVIVTTLVVSAVIQVRGERRARTRARAAGPILRIERATRVESEQSQVWGLLVRHPDAIAFYPLSSTDDLRIRRPGAARAAPHPSMPDRSLVRIEWAAAEHTKYADFAVADLTTWLDDD